MFLISLCKPVLPLSDNYVMELKLLLLDYNVFKVSLSSIMPWWKQLKKNNSPHQSVLRKLSVVFLVQIIIAWESPLILNVMKYIFNIWFLIHSPATVIQTPLCLLIHAIISSSNQVAEAWCISSCSYKSSTSDNDHQLSRWSLVIWGIIVFLSKQTNLAILLWTVALCFHTILCKL